MSIASLVTVSLDEHVEQLEMREQARKERESTSTPTKRAPRSVTPLDERAAVEDPIAESFDRLTAVFDEHAQNIIDASSRPDDALLRQREAFAAIRKLAPLTYAEDKKIAARLRIIIAEKLATETSVLPSAEPSMSIFTRPPPLQTTDFSMAATTLASLAKILQPQPVKEDDDPFVGKTINTRSVRARAAVLDDDD